MMVSYYGHLQLHPNATSMHLHLHAHSLFFLIRVGMLGTQQYSADKTRYINARHLCSVPYSSLHVFIFQQAGMQSPHPL